MHSTIDSPIEEPHKFLGDLDLTNPVLLRQLMILIHNTLYPTVNDRINCCLFPNCLLSDVQQASFDRIVEETKENREELLGKMLKWWCAHYGKGNAEVVGVTGMLRRYVSWYVRCPRLYMVEAEDARREWEGFMRRGGKESEGEHEDVEEVEEAGKVKGRRRLVRRADRRGLVVSSPERSDARKPKAKVQYKEETSADEEVKAEESSSSSEEEEVNSFKDTLLPGPNKRTRSGASFNTRMYWQAHELLDDEVVPDTPSKAPAKGGKQRGRNR